MWKLPLISKISLRNILTFVISLIYVSAIFIVFIRVAFPTILDTSSFARSLAVFLIIAILFKPFEMLINWCLDKIFFRGTIYDFLKHKRIMEKELEHHERMKSVGILAAGVAHEIKNPLAAINTFAEYLPTKYEDPEFRAKFTRIVQAEVQRVNNIVQSLLVFSKPTYRNPKIFDVGEIILFKKLYCNFISRNVHSFYCSVANHITSISAFFQSSRNIVY